MGSSSAHRSAAAAAAAVAAAAAAAAAGTRSTAMDVRDAGGRAGGAGRTPPARGAVACRLGGPGIPPAVVAARGVVGRLLMPGTMTKSQPAVGEVDAATTAGGGATPSAPPSTCAASVAAIK